MQLFVEATVIGWTAVLPCNDNQGVEWPVVSRALKELREAAKISKAELARRCDIHKATVGRLENAENRPDLETIEQWVKACGATLSGFFLQVETGSKPAIDLSGAPRKAAPTTGLELDPTSVDADAIARLGKTLIDAAIYARKVQGTRQSVRPPSRKRSGTSG